MLRYPLLLSLVAIGCFGYTYRETLDTSRGACQGPGYGPIPVGQEGFDDGRCERIECRPGMRTVAGCGRVVAPTDPRCRLARGTGHYPACCPTVDCDPKN